MSPAGLPHSEIPGSTVVCTSPRLIAACHVLHRFPEPRHPPYALSCLTSISSSPRARKCAPEPPSARRGANGCAPPEPGCPVPPPPAGRLETTVSTNSLGAPCQRASGSRPASAEAPLSPTSLMPAACLTCNLLVLHLQTAFGAAPAGRFRQVRRIARAAPGDRGPAPRSLPAISRLPARHRLTFTRSRVPSARPSHLVENTGLEPVTSCLQSRRSPN